MNTGQVARYASADVPTHYGRVTVVVFRLSTTPSPAADPPRESSLVAHDREHMAVVVGDIAAVPEAEGVLCRVHSECWTGEVLRSTKCDCRAQFDEAMRVITAEGRGIIVYLRQEGRGIGLGNKIRAYALQANGVDTVEANRMLGFGDDDRTYDIAAAILKELGVGRVRLLTNNPQKVSGLEAHGIRVVRREALRTAPTEDNADYLAVKAKKMGHDL